MLSRSAIEVFAFFGQKPNFRLRNSSLKRTAPPLSRRANRTPRASLKPNEDPPQGSGPPPLPRYTPLSPSLTQPACDATRNQGGRAHPYSLSRTTSHNQCSAVWFSFHSRECGCGGSPMDTEALDSGRNACSCLAMPRTAGEWVL